MNWSLAKRYPIRDYMNIRFGPFGLIAHLERNVPQECEKLKRPKEGSFVGNIGFIQHQAKLIHDFAPDLDGYILRSTSIGSSGEICALAVNRELSSDDEMSHDTNTEDPYTYKVFRVSAHGSSVTTLEEAC